MTRRTLATAALAAAMLTTMTGPALAGAPLDKHRSCQAFGTGLAAWAQTEPGTAGRWASGVNSTGAPGVVADILHAEKAGLVAGVEGCQPH